MKFSKINYKNAIKTTVAGIALACCVSSVRAQAPYAYAAGNTVMLPYGGYYGAPMAINPSVNPYGYQGGGPYLNSLGYDYNSLGFGQYGVGGYANNYDSSSFANSGFPLGGAIINGVPEDGVPYPSVGGTALNGQYVSPNEPNGYGYGPYMNANDMLSAAGQPIRNTVLNTQLSRQAQQAQQNPILIRRGPYNRIDVAYRGNTNNVARITVMLLNGARRELTEEILDSAPAEALMRPTIGARYVRVTLEYTNGATQSMTTPIPVRR